MVSWTCWRALLNWPTLRSGGVFRLRGTTAISQRARAVEGLLDNMSSRSILGGAAVARCCRGAFSGCLPWQGYALMRSRALDDGKMLARCALRRRWRDCALMRSWPDWQWQYSRAVRSRASIRGKFCAPCIPKVASGGKIASSWQDSRAMHPKTSWLWQDMRAMHPKSPANSRLGIHRAKILPGRGAFRCTDPSNHARRADLAIPRCSV